MSGCNLQNACVVPSPHCQGTERQERSSIYREIIDCILAHTWQPSVWVILKHWKDTRMQPKGCITWLHASCICACYSLCWLDERTVSQSKRRKVFCDYSLSKKKLFCEIESCEQEFQWVGKCKQVDVELLPRQQNSVSTYLWLPGDDLIYLKTCGPPPSGGDTSRLEGEKEKVIFSWKRWAELCQNTKLNFCSNLRRLSERLHYD